jgi:hypothetical protein
MDELRRMGSGEAMTKQSGMIRVELSDRDAKKLLRLDQRGQPRLMDPDKGAYPALTRRFQDGCEKIGKRTFMACSLDDALTAARWWVKTGGKPGSGGWQRYWPIRSLAPFLPSYAPMFADLPVDAPKSNGTGWYTYVKQFVRRDMAKIGRGDARRALRTRDTDNPDGYFTLLVEEWPSQSEMVAAERSMKTRFAQWHVEGEKYMLHPTILKWVEERVRRQGGTLPKRLRRSAA